MPPALLSAVTLIVALSSAACDDGYLRGAVEPSPDGKTHFGVIDDGHVCQGLRLDGVIWSYPLGSVAPIAPGRHRLACGNEDEDTGIGFIVPSGVIFRFDYWGP
jgi:hypothetical protein